MNYSFTSLSFLRLFSNDAYAVRPYKSSETKEFANKHTYKAACLAQPLRVVCICTDRDDGRKTIRCEYIRAFIMFEHGQQAANDILTFNNKWLPRLCWSFKVSHCSQHLKRNAWRRRWRQMMEWIKCRLSSRCTYAKSTTPTNHIVSIEANVEHKAKWSHFVYSVHRWIIVHILYYIIWYVHTYSMPTRRSNSLTYGNGIIVHR